MTVTIIGSFAQASIEIDEVAKEAVRMGFNPSGLDDVNRLKALSSAFITECNRIIKEKPESARELYEAKTEMQTASMWAVLGATKGL